MADIRNDFVGSRPRNTGSKFRDESFNRESRLLDDVVQGAARHWLAAMDRNADGANRWSVVKQDMMTSANPVDLESEPQQGLHGLLPGNRRQTLRSHVQAAMVR